MPASWSVGSSTGSHAAPRGATPTNAATSIGSAPSAGGATSGRRYTPGAPSAGSGGGRKPSPARLMPSVLGARRRAARAPLALRAHSFVVDALVDEVEFLHRHLAAALGCERGPDPLLRLRVLEHEAQHLVARFV